MRARVIVNPFARGGVTGREWPRISELLSDTGLSFDHQFTQGVGHGIELAREAVEKGYELVIAVGGDGTVHEVVNGLVDDEGRGGATLGIVSVGVGGDIIRTLGTPRGYGPACRLFSNFKQVPIDLGVVEYMSHNERVRRFYINTAGLGFDGEVVERLLGSRLRRIKGTIPYVISLLLTLAGYQNKRVIVDIDGAKEERRLFSLIVNNGRYFGGGMKIAPDADMSDGLLDVVILGDLGKLEVLRAFYRVYRGTHVTHPKVTLCRGRSISVESAGRALVQADGELLGETPASFRVLPSALTVAV